MVARAKPELKDYSINDITYLGEERQSERLCKHFLLTFFVCVFYFVFCAMVVLYCVLYLFCVLYCCRTVPCTGLPFALLLPYGKLINQIKKNQTLALDLGKGEV